MTDSVCFKVKPFNFQGHPLYSLLNMLQTIKKTIIKIYTYSYKILIKQKVINISLFRLWMFCNLSTFLVQWEFEIYLVDVYVNLQNSIIIL